MDVGMCDGRADNVSLRRASCEGESLAGTGVEGMGIRRRDGGLSADSRCLLQCCGVDVSLAPSGSLLLGAWCSFARKEEASAEVGRSRCGEHLLHPRKHREVKISRSRTIHIQMWGSAASGWNSMAGSLFLSFWPLVRGSLDSGFNWLLRFPRAASSLSLVAVLREAPSLGSKPGDATSVWLVQ